MEITVNRTRLVLVHGDITVQATDAIVNAANSSLMGGGGVDGAIHRVGGPSILKECKEIVAKQGRLPVGQAVITTGGNLPAKYVIHTVGPIWNGGNREEPGKLASAYSESLRLAELYKLKSISFPSISTGVYRYPVTDAAKIAINTAAKFATDEAESVKEIVFVLFDEGTYAHYEMALDSVRMRLMR
jgi:O-acetyl-ADP-ribose deacetylase